MRTSRSKGPPREPADLPVAIEARAEQSMMNILWWNVRYWGWSAPVVTVGPTIGPVVASAEYRMRSTSKVKTDIHFKLEDAHRMSRCIGIIKGLLGDRVKRCGCLIALFPARVPAFRSLLF